jgi:DNA-binding CsgD family transcriptional regulator/PAS domain-containing protein
MATARRPLPALDRLVTELYGALAEDTSLGLCIDRLSVLFHSHMTGFRTEDVSSHKARFTLYGEAPADMLDALARDYAKRWVGQNLWMERSVAGYISQGFQFGEAVVSDAELLASPYYQNMLRPAGIRHGFGICLAQESPSTFALLGFNRRASIGPMNADEIALVRQLRPHLVNIHAIHRRFAETDARLQSMRNGFDQLPFGALLLDADGCIVEANAAAARLLDGGHPVRRNAAGQLCAATSADRQRLRAAVAACAAAAGGEGQSLLFVPPQGAAVNGVMLHLRPFPLAISSARSHRPRVFGFLYRVSDSGDRAFGLRILQTCLDLTRSEAAVVMQMRQGQSTDNVAKALAVSTNTVKTHLKSAFRKTGTSRQAELLLLAERLVGPTPPAAN